MTEPAKPSGEEIAAAFCEEVLTPEFFEKHWETFPVHRSAAKNGKRANQLPDVLNVDDIMALIRSSGSSLKMFKQGDPYDLDNFLIGYLDGASLIVNQADRLNPSLLGMCKHLAKLHFHHVFGVMYLTPPNSQAVRIHSDDQDVFLFQVWGTKRWTIRNSPQRLPYTEEMLGKDTPVPENLITEPVLEFTMEPHDVLYIPRGYLHEANTGDGELSLHITVTIPTSDYCWGVQTVKHFIHTVHQRSLPPPTQALLAGSMSPHGAAGQQLSDDVLDEQLSELMKAWTTEMKVKGVLDAFDQRMARTNEGQVREGERSVAARAESDKRRPVVTEGSRVKLAYGITCECEEDSEIAVFTRAGDGRHLHLDIKKSAAPLIRSLTGKPQLVADLPCLDGFERACVLQLLLHHQVIQLLLPAEEESAPK